MFKLRIKWEVYRIDLCDHANNFNKTQIRDNSDISDKVQIESKVNYLGSKYSVPSAKSIITSL